MVNPHCEFSRRALLAQAGSGFGAVALAGLLARGTSASTQVKPRRQIAPQAKSVVWLFMNGGPSGIDLFDPKPTLDKWDGKDFPGSIETLFPYPGPIMKSPFRFSRHGETGAPVSEVMPHLARHVDDLTFLLACGSEAQNHSPACYMVNTGVTRFGSPCVGSWLSYGLGRETDDLPAFIVMHDHRSSPEGGSNLWDAGFLPGEHQGVPFQPSKSPVLYLSRPGSISAARQAGQLSLLRKLNATHQSRLPHEPALEARIRSFETAFRMQTSVPDFVDVSEETPETQRLYGLEEQECHDFGKQLLMTRRLIERGVRCIQIYHGGLQDNWDHHAGLKKKHTRLCFQTDQPIAGFLTDLKRRGLLDSTLVIWGGEFGRGPTSQDRDGRDHNPFGFTMWLAGGGVKPGVRHGETDEFGYQPVRDAVSMHDLHATILHLMGLDSDSLSHFHNGRDQTLTNGLDSVVHEVIA